LILPLISTEPVNLEPNCTFCPLPVAPVVTTNISPLATDAVADPLAIKGDAAACTFVICEPSPMNANALIEPLISIEPVNCEPI